MPFIRTAVLGSEGSPLIPAEFIANFNMIRLRVRGSGVLRPTMYAMDDVTSITLPTITMSDPAQYIKESKTNFNTQRMSLKLETTAIDEIAYVNKIIIFVRPLWSSLPG